MDKSREIEDLLGECNWFALGSRIIITTRNKQVLTTLGKDHQIYEVTKLNQSEAYKLFRFHAFPIKQPEEDYLKTCRANYMLCQWPSISIKK